uniref:Uncharacterized protein n=1 Tax=Megaselia scalaris TaxID=36166 RepID=T1GJB6_MEGSC
MDAYSRNIITNNYKLGALEISAQPCFETVALTPIVESPLKVKTLFISTTPKTSSIHDIGGGFGHPKT